jgi:hypothetical protein
VSVKQTCSLVRAKPLAFFETLLKNLYLVLQLMPFGLDIFGLGCQLSNTLFVHLNDYLGGQDLGQFRDETVLRSEVHNVIGECPK